MDKNMSLDIVNLLWLLLFFLKREPWQIYLLEINIFGFLKMRGI